MIKELDVIREPRGLSWQNWVMSCKDSLQANAPRVLLFVAVGTAIVSGALLAKSAVNEYANRTRANSSRVQLIPQSHVTPNSTSNLNKVSTPTASTTKSSLSDLQEDTSHDSPPRRASSGSSAVVDTGYRDSSGKIIAQLCDTVSRAAAQGTYHATIATENTFHATQVTIINTTYAVEKLLHPTTFSQRLVKETARHENVLTSAGETYQGVLAKIHCNS